MHINISDENEKSKHNLLFQRFGTPNVRKCYRKNFYELGNSMYGYLEAERAYLRALMTWADWVDANVNPNKTRVFFRGYSNVHYR